MRMLIALLAAALLLSGCVSAADRALRKTPDYRAGYDDGCSSATASGTSYNNTPVRDPDAYGANKAYRAGWNTGYSACRRTTPGAGRDTSISMPGPGH